MYDVITVGTATRDIFIKSPLFKIVRDKSHLKKMGFVAGEATCFALGSKIEVEPPVFTTGGGASNGAVTFARQGFKTATLIKIGDDKTGQLITEELKEEGVAPFAIHNKKTTTDTGIILLSPNGERTILINHTTSGKLLKREIPFEKLKSKWAYIVPGSMPLSVVKSLVDHFYKNNASIALNPSKQFIEEGLNKITPILKKTNVFLLNREEASYLTKIDYDNKKEIFKKLDKVIGGLLVMTDGENGAYISDNSIVYTSSIFRGNKVVDETGAGDAFGSGFISGLMNKKEICSKGSCDENSIEHAIRLATANSRSVIEHVGAKKGILTKHDFESSSRWKKLPIVINKVQ